MTLLAKMSSTSYIRSNIREYEVVGDRAARVRARVWGAGGGAGVAGHGRAVGGGVRRRGDGRDDAAAERHDPCVAHACPVRAVAVRGHVGGAGGSRWGRGGGSGHSLDARLTNALQAALLASWARGWS